MTDTITIKAPADTLFTVQADAEWFGRYFAAAPSDEQAEMLASMVRHLAPFALQWDYVSIELDKHPDAREIKDILTMLGRDA